MHNPLWTDDRVELLKKLWRDGLSASQIARQLGGVTRNAVIGKVHRLGLSGRRTTSRVSAGRCRPALARGAKRKQVRPALMSAAPGAGACKTVKPVVPAAPVGRIDTVPPAGSAAFATLAPAECRWIFNDPRDDALACGKPTAATVHDGGPLPELARDYCMHHLMRSLSAEAQQRLFASLGDEDRQRLLAAVRIPKQKGDDNAPISR